MRGSGTRVNQNELKQSEIPKPERSIPKLIRLKILSLCHDFLESWEIFGERFSHFIATLHRF
jgi:hypothetical protein